MQNYLPSPSLHPNDVMMTNLQNLSAGQGANTATYMSVEELPTLFMPPVNQHAQAPAPAPQQTTVYISNARQPGTELSIYSQSVESEQSLGRVEEAAKPTMTVTVGKRTSIETADSRRGSYELANTNSGAYTVQQPIFAQMSPQMPTIFPHPSESLSVPPEVPHHADPVEASINRDMGNSTMGVNPLSPAAQTLTTPTVSAAQLQALGASASSHDVTCPPGWSFSVYDSDIAQHYVVPSECVRITHGAVKYVELFGKYGSQMKFRFQLCNKYMQGRCPLGKTCGYIHCQELPHCTSVHVNENPLSSWPDPRLPFTPQNSHNYETLPEGYDIAIHDPNNADAPPQHVPSQYVLKTVGSTAYMEDLLAALRRSAEGPMPRSSAVEELPRKRHCAHYQFKRMCNLGARCNFIHSLMPFRKSPTDAVGATSQKHPPQPARSAPVANASQYAGFHLTTRRESAQAATDAAARQALHAMTAGAVRHSSLPNPSQTALVLAQRSATGMGAPQYVVFGALPFAQPQVSVSLSRSQPSTIGAGVVSQPGGSLSWGANSI